MNDMSNKDFYVIDEDNSEISDSGYTFHDLAIEDSMGISDYIHNNFKLRAKDIEDELKYFDENHPMVPIAQKAIIALNAAYNILPQIKAQYQSYK